MRSHMVLEGSENVKLHPDLGEIVIYSSNGLKSFDAFLIIQTEAEPVLREALRLLEKMKAEQKS